MAPSKSMDEDFRFIMTCIKHSPPAAKPNFDEVAKEIGAKSANACYHRHWALMKRWGLAGGGVGRARKTAGATGTATLLAAPRPAASTARKRKVGVGRFNAILNKPASNDKDNDNDNDSSSEAGETRSDNADPSPPAKKARTFATKKVPAQAIKTEYHTDDDRDEDGESDTENTVVKEEDDAYADAGASAGGLGIRA